MERKTKLLVVLASLVIFTISLVAAGTFIYINQPDVTLTGSFYFNDSGQHHGGWEATCLWNVSLTMKAGSGLLVVTPEPDYMANDMLLKWIYHISGFQITEDQIVMAIDGHPVILEFVENDTIWNRYHNHYISATPDLSPTIFPGFLSHYYVELRLAPLLIF
ncbi:MAG: hypothetical protein Q6361_01110 [Candidatus Hermodarchaeota archaeon]|nr:hypothetical protein [Candidatus Hermodarchaeota archaeon]